MVKDPLPEIKVNDHKKISELTKIPEQIGQEIKKAIANRRSYIVFSMAKTRVTRLKIVQKQKNQGENEAE